MVLRKPDDRCKPEPPVKHVGRVSVSAFLLSSRVDESCPIRYQFLLTYRLAGKLKIFYQDRSGIAQQDPAIGALYTVGEPYRGNPIRNSEILETMAGWLWSRHFQWTFQCFFFIFIFNLRISRVSANSKDRRSKHTRLWFENIQALKFRARNSELELLSAALSFAQQVLTVWEAHPRGEQCSLNTVSQDGVKCCSNCNLDRPGRFF